MPGQPDFSAAAPPGYPPYGQPPAAPKKRRGVLIVSIVLAVALLLCGGGGVAAFLMLRNAEDGQGAAEATAAVDEFMRAVYNDHDADKAAKLVCSEARDETKIKKRVEEIKKLAETHKNPRFTWTAPKIDDENTERSIVSTKLTMVTSDEKTAEQQLKFTVVEKEEAGWWVCEVA
ncbi:Rv0361 family membrane protein [Micromonospora sonneratiae]|jgi:hypothetical protein